MAKVQVFGDVHDAGEIRNLARQVLENHWRAIQLRRANPPVFEVAHNTIEIRSGAICVASGIRDHRGNDNRDTDGNGGDQMTVVRLRGFDFHPIDGHRHSYDKPGYEKAPPLNLAPGGLNYVMAPWRKVPPEERICRRCGYSELALRTIMRAHTKPKTEDKVVAAAPQSPLRMAFNEAKKIADDNPGGLNNFTLICKNGDDIKAICKTQGFCYAGLARHAKGNTLYFVDKAGCGQNWPIVPEYVRWLYEDSPFNLCLVNGELDYMETRCTIQNTMLPAQYLVQAAMAFRYQYEYPKFIKDWAYLAELGMDPSIAFLFCQFGVIRDGRYIWAGAAAHGHAIFDPAFNRDGLQNYLFRNVQRYGYVYGEVKILTPGYEDMQYSGMMSAWQSVPLDNDKPITLPKGFKRSVMDSLGRETTRSEYDCSTREGVLAMQTRFLTANEVSYEPKESIYCQRRSSLRTDVPFRGVESVKA